MTILKKFLRQFEQRTHSENAYEYSQRATLAAGWWFYDFFFKPDFVQKVFQLVLPPGFHPSDKKTAAITAIKIVDVFQSQIKTHHCVCSTQLKHILTMLTYQRVIEMSDDDKELESAQKDQKKIGKAESNPNTSGPAENLREEAAEMTDESQDSEEPA